MYAAAAAVGALAGRQLLLLHVLAAAVRDPARRDYGARLLRREATWSCDGGGKRRAILLISVAANLSILFVFKYYPFVANTLNGWQRFNLFPDLAIVLPIGLSFHTFQSMGYMFDVYRRKIEPERDGGRLRRLSSSSRSLWPVLLNAGASCCRSCATSRISTTTA